MLRCLHIKGFVGDEEKSRKIPGWIFQEAEKLMHTSLCLFATFSRYSCSNFLNELKSLYLFRQPDSGGGGCSGAAWK